jgi:hypothetical protein
MGARCDCCDLPVESCGRAVEQRLRKEDANARSEALSAYGWFRAQYAGQCAGCGEHFAVGDPISYVADGKYKSYCCLHKVI